MTNINKIIQESFKESIEVKQKTLIQEQQRIEQATNIIIQAIKEKRTIFICGNGGSAADAQHFATELTIRFEKNRPAINAIALTTDTSAITACANDFSFEEIFSRQLQALGKEKDVLIAISTSGNSKNIIKAIDYATQNKIKTIALLGKNGGKIKQMNTNVSIIIPSNTTARIQEAHELIYHTICKIIDQEY